MRDEFVVVLASWLRSMIVDIVVAVGEVIHVFKMRCFVFAPIMLVVFMVIGDVVVLCSVGIVFRC